MKHSSAARRWFLRTALAYLGTPYRWGGDDPSGFDCSGLVVECLKSAGLLVENDDYTADGLLKLFHDKAIDSPREAALLFSLDLRGKTTHVVICLDQFFAVGAGGGTSTTREPADAWCVNAYVKIRPIRMNSDKCIICDPFLP